MKFISALIVLIGLGVIMFGVTLSSYNIAAQIIQGMYVLTGVIAFLGGCINFKLCEILDK